MSYMDEIVDAGKAPDAMSSHRKRVKSGKKKKPDGEHEILASVGFTHGDITCLSLGGDEVELTISLNRTLTQMRIPKELWNMFLMDAEEVK